MPKRDALDTPFADAQSTPDMGGTLPGTTGGFSVQNPASGGAGLTATPFGNPWCGGVGDHETANSSGLPPLLTTVGVPDGPGVGENIPDRGVQGTPMPKITGT